MLILICHLIKVLVWNSAFWVPNLSAMSIRGQDLQWRSTRLLRHQAWEHRGHFTLAKPRSEKFLVIRNERIFISSLWAFPSIMCPENEVFCLLRYSLMPPSAREHRSALLITRLKWKIFLLLLRRRNENTGEVLSFQTLIGIYRQLEPKEKHTILPRWSLLNVWRTSSRLSVYS